MSSPLIQEGWAALREGDAAGARRNAGVTSPAEFFSPKNVGRIFAAAGARIAS